jgi:Iron-sulfur cluster-binding domain
MKLVLGRSEAVTGARYLDTKVEAIISYAEFCAGKEYPKYPLQTFLEVSNVCDLKCAMCTDFSALNPHRFRFLKARERGFMRTEFRDNLEGLLRGTLLVQASGYGEPTVHPEFREFIDFISDYEALIEFITNGMHLTDDLCEFLVSRNVYRVVISFSGMTKEEYEGAYIGGNYEQVLGGIANLAAAKRRAGKRYPSIEINSLAFKHHVARFDDFVTMMADRGANAVLLKMLQPYTHIPELYEHVSIMRPWVEGKITQRAIAIGRDRGVNVSVDQYLDHAAHSQDDYDARISRYEAEAKAGLGSEREYGKTSVQELQTITRRPIKIEDVGTPRKPRPTIALNESVDAAAAALQIGEVPEGRGFYCMEPFKVAYVRKDGAVQACCFGNAHTPALGTVTGAQATDIWRGPGYRALQNGIINGRYPKKYCGRCLKDRVGPVDHYGYHVIGAFLEWYAASHSGELARQIEIRAPSAFRTIVDTRNAQIVENLRRGGNERSIERPPAGIPFEGYFERVVNRHAIGWVWMPSHPEYQVPVTLLQGEEIVGTGVACRPRADLVAAGKGDGFHGFEIMLAARDREWSKSDLVAIVCGGSRLTS